MLLYCPFLFIANLTFLPSISIPVNMEGSKRTSTRIGLLYSSTKKMQKNEKIQSYNRKFVVQQFIKSLQVHYKFIMTSTRGKICSLGLKNGTITLPQ